MKICIVQTASLKGDIDGNIKNHLGIIEQLIPLKSDLIIFPELSLTGYEPSLAKELVRDVSDEIFSPFQKIATTNNCCIGVGMPTSAPKGIHISMIIFQPNKERQCYSKQILHEDELPYFISSTNQPFLNIKGKKIAIGNETLQRKHFLDAVKNECNIYIASVAKPERSTQKANIHFSSIAAEFEIPILMSNAIGYSDNFLSDGQSAVWNEKGALIGQLDNLHQGILMYDTITGNVKTIYT